MNEHLDSEANGSSEDESVVLKDRPKLVTKKWAKVRSMKMAYQFADEKTVWIEPGDWQCVEVGRYSRTWDTGEACMDGDLKRFLQIHKSNQWVALPINIPCPFVRMALPDEELDSGESSLGPLTGILNLREDRYGRIGSWWIHARFKCSRLWRQVVVHMVSNTSKTFQLSLMAGTLFTVVIMYELKESNSFPYNSKFNHSYTLDMQD